ncbi:hypothetical protein ALC57_07047 [Trachymyrmex cornetzi]|uniref:Uncharacterized protein n=1 Tax=Trachymyrmex cornetzi TaxID=471704 RepID=A0A195E5W5_9HYME|nr:hypothetical protein ALC57_07047 [Trachymyrmex cornetzi]
MSFNEFLRDHYKAAVGAAVWSAHVPVPVSVSVRAPRAYICEAQHDADRLSSCALTPLLPRVTKGLHGSDRRPYQDGSVTFMILVQRLRSMIRGEITLGSNHFSVPEPQGQMGRGGVAKSLAKPRSG